MKKPLLRGKYREIFSSLTEAFFPGDGPFSYSGKEIVNPDFVNRYFGYADSDIRSGLKILLLFFNRVAPFISGKGLKKFTSLPLKERVEVLEKLESSENFILRYLLLSLKTVISLFYFDHQETWKDVEYSEECAER